MDVDGLSQSPGLTTLIEPSTSSITLKECVSDLIGEDQHWIYSKTVYQDLVSDSSFAVHKFHFDILQVSLTNVLYFVCNNPFLVQSNPER